MIQTTQYVLSGSTVTSTLNTLACYDPTTGDLLRVVAPNANLTKDTVHCSGTTVDAYTTQYTYTAAHQVASTTDPTGAQTTTSYDADSNVQTVTQTIDHTVTPATSTMTTYGYDQADRQTSVQQQYDPTRTLVTTIQYDAAGNTSVVAPPRATAANPSLSDYTNAAYATTYHYDAANRLKQVDLPNASGGTQQYVLQGYDANGRLTMTSLPESTTTDPAALATQQKTVVGYYDTGLIRTQTDLDHPFKGRFFG